MSEIRNRFGRAGIQNPVASKAGVFEITDDTQMTLFTAEGLIRASVRYDARGMCNPIGVIHRAYGRWFSTQSGEYRGRIRDDKDAGWLVRQRGLWAARAPGNTCLSALRTINDCEPAKNDSKGCGTVMKTAPIGLVCNDPFGMGCEVAALTHGHRTGQIAAGFLSRVISLLVEGGTLAEAIAATMENASLVEGHEETTTAVQRALDASRQKEITPELIETLGGGWVAEEALAISLLCALRAESFEHGVRLAVNHSGDSDSTGAITGNLLGLVMGLESLPTAWLDGLELRDVTERIARDLFEANSGEMPSGDTGVLDFEISDPAIVAEIRADIERKSRGYEEWVEMYPGI